MYLLLRKVHNSPTTGAMTNFVNACQPFLVTKVAQNTSRLLLHSPTPNNIDRPSTLRRITAVQTCQFHRSAEPALDGKRVPPSACPLATPYPSNHSLAAEVSTLPAAGSLTTPRATKHPRLWTKQKNFSCAHHHRRPA